MEVCFFIIILFISVPSVSDNFFFKKKVQNPGMQVCNWFYVEV